MLVGFSLPDAARYREGHKRLGPSPAVLPHLVRKVSFRPEEPLRLILLENCTIQDEELTEFSGSRILRRRFRLHRSGSQLGELLIVCDTFIEFGHGNVRGPSRTCSYGLGISPTLQDRVEHRAQDRKATRDVGEVCESFECYSSVRACRPTDR